MSNDEVAREGLSRGKKIALLTAGGLLVAGIVPASLYFALRPDGSQVTQQPQELSKADKEALMPGSDVTADPDAILKPVRGEKVDSSLVPTLVRDADDIELPQPGTPESEVQAYCNLIAGLVSSDRADLLRSVYGDEPGEALVADEELLAAFNSEVEKIQSSYPATKRALIAIQCTDVELDPQPFSNGSHRTSFSLSASMIDERGNVYARSFWDSSNILEDRIVTLNRDGFQVRSNGDEELGIKAEWSELRPD